MSNGHRVVARLALAVAAALTLPAAARAACLALPGDPGSGEAYQYMSAVVASMGHAKKGLDTLKKQGKADHGSERLYRMKVAGESYACAQRLIERFRESRDRRIRETADVLTIGFENLGHSNRQAAEMMVAVTKASAPVSEGTLSDAGAMLRQQDEGAWRDLMLALALTPQAMPLYYPDGSNAKRLRLKKSERQELQGTLERTFGESIRTGVLNGEGHLTTAAAGIHTFLGNTRLRSLDDR